MFFGCVDRGGEKFLEAVLSWYVKSYIIHSGRLFITHEKCNKNKRGGHKSYAAVTENKEWCWPFISPWHSPPSLSLPLSLSLSLSPAIPAEFMWFVTVIVSSVSDGGLTLHTMGIPAHCWRANKYILIDVIGGTKAVYGQLYRSLRAKNGTVFNFLGH